MTCMRQLRGHFLPFRGSPAFPESGHKLPTAHPDWVVPGYPLSERLSATADVL